MGESYSGIRALADFIRDVTKYQQYPEKVCSRTMAIKPGRSSKLDAVIGFDDWGGSMNSHLGAERFWIERFSMI